MTACTLLSPLYWAMYSMLCPFTMLGASCRVYLTYRSTSARDVQVLAGRHRLFHLLERIDQHVRREPAAVVVDEDAAERRHGFHEPVELGLLHGVVQTEDPEVHGEVQHH